MSEFREQVYRHATYGAVKSWRERRGRYRLEGSRCSGCGAVSFPRRVACRECHGRDLEPYECARTGTLVVAWPQVVLARLLGYADLPKRFVGVVRLDDGIHVETELLEVTRETAKPGLRVAMVVRKLRRESNGNETYGYKFIPLEAAGEAATEGVGSEAEEGAAT
jgi:hypothetical protein